LTGILEIPICSLPALASGEAENTRLQISSKVRKDTPSLFHAATSDANGAANELAPSISV